MAQEKNKLDESLFPWLTPPLQHRSYLGRLKHKAHHSLCGNTKYLHHKPGKKNYHTGPRWLQ
jgi:hypothetical protein